MEAKMCRVEFKDNYKWLTLIQNSIVNSSVSRMKIINLISEKYVVKVSGEINAETK